ncbi:MAG: DHH family phosphoesterase, partial [Methanomassiliicoccaceae archaeon]|nr:DHH family phosphoesterase [Methanomassiliicoccaceae archaeon]
MHTDNKGHSSDADRMFRQIGGSLKGKNKVILVHGNADMDAVGSAYAVAECFPPAKIYAPDGIDRVAKMVMDKLGAEVVTECDISDHELVVIVDTSSPEQFGQGFPEIPEGSIVIDHHRPTGKWDHLRLVCDETKVSCCELIYEILRASDIGIGRNVGLALLSGMLTDSG